MKHGEELKGREEAKRQKSKAKQELLEEKANKAKERIRVRLEAEAAAKIFAQERERKRIKKLEDRDRRQQEMLKRRQASAKDTKEKKRLKDLRREARSLGQQCSKMGKKQRANGTRSGSKGKQSPFYAFHFSGQLLLEAVCEAVDIGSAVGAQTSPAL